MELDVVDVTKIARMLEQATEHDPATAPAKVVGAVVGGPGRFVRDPGEFAAANASAKTTGVVTQ